MVKTYGLTHVALAVRDAEISSRFYQKVFGAVETWRGEGWAQVETAGTHDVIVFTEGVFTEGEPRAGKGADSVPGSLVANWRGRAFLGLFGCLQRLEHARRSAHGV